jgi:hypothetical protein
MGVGIAPASRLKTSINMISFHSQTYILAEKGVLFIFDKTIEAA